MISHHFSYIQNCVEFSLLVGFRIFSSSRTGNRGSCGGIFVLIMCSSLLKFSIAVIRGE